MKLDLKAIITALTIAFLCAVGAWGKSWADNKDSKIAALEEKVRKMEDAANDNRKLWYLSQLEKEQINILKKRAGLGSFEWPDSLFFEN